ncbi:lachesin-like isoform X4 [Mytilus californianus]|uniref:lachesin-like isoform X4 n=1 Tax=Mytilus californianus TaxID=6549 RepID=UPI0022462642|nr:lachesin-like isoform X4 [Mytilus californianus]
MINVVSIGVLSSMLYIVYAVRPETVEDSLPEVNNQDQKAYMNCSVIHLQLQWNKQTHSTPDPLYISMDNTVRVDLFVEGRNKYSVVKYRTNNRKTYQLIIESLTEIEAGNYTCQIYLPNQNYEELPRMFRDVTVQIAPYIKAASAAIITVQEGENITLACEAYGYPLPNITWKRVDGSPLPNGGLQLTNGIYKIYNVSATDRGQFICTADNNVKPQVSYTVQLAVRFAPYCTAVQDAVGQIHNQRLHAILDCLVSAEPRAEVVWYKENSTTLQKELIRDNDKYTLEQQYDKRLKADEKWYTLTIKNVVGSDNGDYYCSAKNELGKKQAKFQLFEVFDCRFNTHGKVPSTYQVSMVTYISGFIVSFISIKYISC